jgi:hypothetical protein
MSPARSYVLILVALAAGTFAFLWARSTMTRHAAAHPATTEQADYYCYELSTAWVCTRAKADCETRLANEPSRDPKARCKAHYDEGLTP